MTDPASMELLLSTLDTFFDGRAAGKESAEIRSSVLPATWRDVLARAAVAGEFDRDLFDRFVNPDPQPGQPSPDALAEAGLVHPIEGRAGWFAVAPPDRGPWASQLPDDVVNRLESSLAQEYLRDGDELAGLRHLLVADPEGGRRLMTDLIEASDAALDLPRCRDILAVTEEEGSLGARLADSIAADKAYINARTMWLHDLSLSAQFLAPEGIEAAADELQSGQSRVWEITGQGGGGKTMELRWLISRHWVPRPGSTPCARIDLDTIDPAMIARHPFLILVLAAEQLGRQLPKNPFSTMTRSYGPYLDVARRSGLGGEIDPSQARVAAAEVPRLFAAGLSQTGGPVILVLDTMEELSQRYPMQTTELLDLLARMLKEAPGLRLVVAGRFEIRAVRERFPDRRALPVRPFDEGRAHQYLGEVRGIEDADRRADIVARSNGLPFLLALYADLVTGDPELVLAALGPGQAPHLIYLVERVVDRIDQPLVRWLLRYGCAARRLSADYVLDVMAPFLITVAAGTRTLDDPMTDPITEWRGRPLFPTDLPDLRQALGQAWADLQGYVSNASWVSQDDAATIVFKAEVLGPMREFLARQPVWRDLHRESARFYLARAAGSASPERWQREALFHTFQAGDDLTGLWHRCADSAREAGRYEGLIDLCAELTAPEYASQEGDRGPSAELLAEALLWRGYAALAIGVRDEQELADPLVEASLRSNQLIDQAGSAPPGLAGERGELILAAYRVCRSAGRGISPAGSSIPPPAAVSQDLTLTWLWMAARGHGATEWTRVRDAAMAAGRGDDVIRATLKIIDAQTIRGSLSAAANTLQTVSNLDRRVEERRIWLSIDSGRPLDMSTSPSSSGLAQIASKRLHARRLVTQFQAPLAMDLITSCERDLTELTELTGEPVRDRLREQADCLQVRGLVCAALLRLDESIKAFEQSTSLWQELGHPHGHLRSRYEHANVLLRSIGDVGAAVKHLRGLNPVLDASWAAQEVRLALAHALAHHGDRGAGEIVQTVMQALPPDQHFRRAQAAAAGLSLGMDQGGAVGSSAAMYGKELLRCLTRIHPAEARLRVLEPLRWALTPPPGDLGARLLQAAGTVPMEATPARRAQPTVSLRAALVARACGDDVRATEWAQLAFRDADPAETRFWLTLDRLAGVVPPSLLAAAARMAPDDPLGGLILLRRAEQILAQPVPALGEASDLLERALPRLGKNHVTNRFGPEHTLALAALARWQDQEARSELLSRAAAESYERLGDTNAVPDTDALRLARQFAPGRHVDPTSEFVVQASEVPSDDGQSIIERLQKRSAGRVIRVESQMPGVLELPWDDAGLRVYRALPARSAARIHDRPWLNRLSELGQIEAELLRTALIELDHGLVAGTRRSIEESVPRGQRTVCVVRGDREAERSWGYGSADSGLDLADSYRRSGWDYAELDSDSIASRPVILERDMTVVHVTGRLELSGTVAWFDMSEEDRGTRRVHKYQGNERGLFSTDLARWLSGETSATSLLPVLLLDPVLSPSMDRELARRARDSMAASLFVDCPVMAVVAGGLTEDPLAMQSAWLDGVQSGLSLVDTIRQMRDARGTRVAPALFAPSSTFGI